jgi:hypothetical protein
MCGINTRYKEISMLFLTVDKTSENSITFMECFDYLQKTLQDYNLLTASEREECVNAVDKLKQVFSRFQEKRK